MAKMLLILFALCCIKVVIAQTPDATITINQGTIDLYVNEAENLLTVKARVSTQAYFACGISPQAPDGANGMIDADIIVAGVVGETGYIRDYKGPIGGPGPPTPDPDSAQVSELISYSEENGVTTVEFTRPLVSDDQANHIDITSNPINFIWALGNGDADTEIVYHADRGKETIRLLEDDNNSSTETPASPPDSSSTEDPTSSTNPGPAVPDATITINQGTIELYVNKPENLLRVKATVTSEAYFGCGISPQAPDGANGMIDADIIVAGVVGETGYIRDYKGPSGGPGPPSPDPDSSQVSELISYSEENGVTTVEFTRPLASDDQANHIDITSGPINFIWALGNGDADTAIVYHADRGKETITLWKDDDTSPTTPGTSPTTPGTSPTTPDTGAAGQLNAFLNGPSLFITVCVLWRFL